MSEKALRFATAEALDAFGHRLAALLRPGDVVTLQGDLGAGKTTFARGLLRGLGHEGDVPSPTFAILQGYEPPETDFPVAHVDLYRIEDESDLEELGFDEWLADGALAIEWPDRLGTRYGEIALAISIAVEPDGTRCLTARVPKLWESRWPAT